MEENFDCQTENYQLETNPSYVHFTALPVFTTSMFKTFGKIYYTIAKHCISAVLFIFTADSESGKVRNPHYNRNQVGFVPDLIF